MTFSYGSGESVWMHPPVHRILGWSSRPSNFNLKRNVWKLNQASQIIDNDIFVRGEPAISDLNTLNRFPSLLFANLINSNGHKIGYIADFIFQFKTGNIKFYLVSRSNPNIPGSSRWKLDIDRITDQQPGLVFCSLETLDDLPIVKSSLKNQILKKSKIFFDKFDDIKNIASDKLEDWLEEENYDDNNEFQYDETFKNNNSKNKIRYKEKNLNSDNINLKSSQNKKNDDPWI